MQITMHFIRFFNKYLNLLQDLTTDQSVVSSTE